MIGQFPVKLVLAITIASASSAGLLKNLKQKSKKNPVDPCFQQSCSCMDQLIGCCCFLTDAIALSGMASKKAEAEDSVRSICVQLSLPEYLFV